MGSDAASCTWSQNTLPLSCDVFREARWVTQHSIAWLGIHNPVHIKVLTWSAVRKGNQLPFSPVVQFRNLCCAFGNSWVKPLVDLDWATVMSWLLCPPQRGQIRKQLRRIPRNPDFSEILLDTSLFFLHYFGPFLLTLTDFGFLLDCPHLNIVRIHIFKNKI